MSEEFDIHLNSYEGPLDLLLELVREKQMDIFSIDLIQLASEYIKVIDKLKQEDIDLAGDYLVMAATLINLKAKALLKNPEQEEEIQQTKKEILGQLIQRQQYKMLATKLKLKEQERKKYFIKSQDDLKEFKTEIDESQLDGNSNPVKLILNLRKMFERNNAMALKNATIEKFNMTPEERREEILEIFKNKKHVSFDDIFSVPSMNHFVTTVITVLDMARRQELKIYQEKQFGDIVIEKGELYGI